jgi:hypothetical protein
MQCRVLPAALVGVVALISATSVQAASFNDTYAGGANYYNPNANNGDVKGDVIGDVNLFNTTSMDVNRIEPICRSSSAPTMPLIQTRSALALARCS